MQSLLHSVEQSKKQFSGNLAKLEYQVNVQMGNLRKKVKGTTR